MDKLNFMYDLCEWVFRELCCVYDEAQASGKDLDDFTLDRINKLTHSLKSIKACIAMMEEEIDDVDVRTNQNGRNASYRGSSYRGKSYARGRMGNVRRDSMGRYSRDEGLMDQLHEMMENTPNERKRQEIQRFIAQMEDMN